MQSTFEVPSHSVNEYVTKSGKTRRAHTRKGSTRKYKYGASVRQIMKVLKRHLHRGAAKHGAPQIASNLSRCTRRWKRCINPLKT